MPGPDHPNPQHVRITLLAAVLLIQQLVAAQAAPLKIATWNLDWLTTRKLGDPGLPRDVRPRVPADFTRLQSYASILNADVVAFEEVDGPEVAARLFPPAGYRLHLTADSVVQRIGLAVRTSIAFTVNPDVTGLDVTAPDAVRHLRSGADITLDLPAGRHLRILAIHLKSGCQQALLAARTAACTELAAQIPLLQSWIAARRAEGAAFIVMGDFNRVMDDPADSLLAALRTAAPLTRGTEGFADPCWGGQRFIDHLLLGGDAQDWLVPDSLRVLVYAQTDRRQKDHLSDHCPVSIRLDPDRATGARP